MNSSQAAEDQIKQQMIETLTLRSDQFHKQIVEDAQQEVARLPEDIFKKDFLPFFSGEQTFLDRESTVALWIGIAGTPQSEVAIIDRENTELFRVPPIADTQHLNVLTRNKGESFSDIAAISALYSNNIPVQGERYLAESIDNKLGTLVGDTALSNKQRWDDILVRYGKGTKSQVTHKETIGQQNDDLIDYDET